MVPSSPICYMRPHDYKSPQSHSRACTVSRHGPAYNMHIQAIAMCTKLTDCHAQCLKQDNLKPGVPAVKK